MGQSRPVGIGHLGRTVIPHIALDTHDQCCDESVSFRQPIISESCSKLRFDLVLKGPSEWGGAGGSSMDSVVDTGGGRGGASSLSSSFTAPPCAAPDQQVARDGLLLHTPPPPPPHQQLARGGLLLHTPPPPCTLLHTPPPPCTLLHTPPPPGTAPDQQLARGGLLLPASSLSPPWQGVEPKKMCGHRYGYISRPTQTNVEPWGSSIAIASRESIPTLIPLPEHTRSIRQSAGADGGLDSAAREG